LRDSRRASAASIWSSPITGVDHRVLRDAGRTIFFQHRCEIAELQPKLPISRSCRV